MLYLLAVAVVREGDLEVGLELVFPAPLFHAGVEIVFQLHYDPPPPQKLFKVVIAREVLKELIAN